MKNEQKGFVIPTIITVVVLLVIVCGYVYFKSNSVKTISELPVLNTVNNVPTPTPKGIAPIVPIKTNSSQVIENGKGVVKSVYTQSGKNYLDIDYIESFQGINAVKAIIEDKKCLSDSTQKSLEELAKYIDSVDVYESFRGTKFEECLPPNGVYDRNNNSKIRTFEISGNVSISTVYLYITTVTAPELHWSVVSPTPMSWSDFYRYFNMDKSALKYGPYSIEITNNIVTKITQNFRP